MSEPFAVVADPTRRRVLDLLRTGPRTVTDLVDALGVSQPTVSKHLRVLREAGIVTVRAEAQRRWYEIDPAPLAAIDDWLAPYRWMWADRLDALGHHLDRMEDDPDA
ncbi:MAG: transcriptional regulator [Pseudonocardia sp. SCN 72-86]|nr:MAG: transcriptional regulator [Pseudonocardia sp. SCN 72-86]